MKKRRMISLLVVYLTLLPLKVVCADNTANRPHVEVQHPVRKDVHRQLTLVGNIVANAKIIMMTRVGGYLEKLHIDRGSTVRKDDVIAVISVPELMKQLGQDKSELDASGPAIKLAEADLAWKEAQFKRASELFRTSKNLISQDAVDEMRGRYEMASAELDLRKKLASLAVIRAPFDGVITERFVDVGELVRPNVTPLATLVEMDPVRVAVEVPEPETPFVRIGNNVSLTVDALKGKTFTAKISRSSWALHENSKTMTVEIDVSNPEKELRPGMFGAVTLSLEVHQNALMIPSPSLVMEKTKTFVFVVRDRIAKKVPIELGIDSGLEVEVTKGLSEKDEVITVGKNLITDGEAVDRTMAPVS